MQYSKSVKDFLDFCLHQRGLSKGTVKAYDIDLKQFNEFMRENKNWCSKENLTGYISYLHNKYKPKSAKRKIATLKAFYNFLEYEEIIEVNPFSKIKLKYREPVVLPKTIDLSDIEKILVYAHSQTQYITSKYQYEVDLRSVAILELLFATGARISELCSLKVRDVNLKEKYIKIYGKGAKERVISIPNSQVIKALRRYAELNSKEGDEYFFTNRLKNRYSEQSARNMITKYIKECGINYHITPHMFRHSFATYLLDNDVDIRYIQHLLGHSSIATTQIYTHISNTKEKSILSKKHPRNKFKA